MRQNNLKSYVCFMLSRTSNNYMFGMQHLKSSAFPSKGYLMFFLDTHGCKVSISGF